jgi:hypothetical protein
MVVVTAEGILAAREYAPTHEEPCTLRTRSPEEDDIDSPRLMANRGNQGKRCRDTAFVWL